jgi:hypothetical protein
MDFDDMPDSYFAFLSNQKKLADAEKINGAMKELGRGSEPPAAATNGAAGSQPGAKVKSRASQPQVGGGSKPSVPSLPSIQRTSTTPSQGGSSPGAVAAAAAAAAAQNKPGSRPGANAIAKPPSRPNLTSSGANKSSRPGGAMSSAGMSMSGNFGLGAHAQAQPPKSNALVFVLIAILLAAIGVLAYLVLTK